MVPSTNNFYGIREIEELEDSIKESGLLHNLVVRKLNDKYEILSGERRYHALKKLGYKKVPCQVKELNDLDSELLLIQANSKQRELTPTEKMEAIKRLKIIYDKKRKNGEEIPSGKTRDLIGKDIGMSGVQVGRHMKINNNLIDGLKDMLDKKTISFKQALDLSNLDNEEQTNLYDQIKYIDPNEKEEINILISGIKQPIENEEDKELIPINRQEVSKTNESSNNRINAIEELNEFKLKKIKELLEKDKKPKLVLNGQVYGILETKSVLLEDNTFTILLEDGHMKVKLDFYYARKVPYINYIDERLTPDNAWMINSDVYIWFSNEREGY